MLLLDINVNFVWHIDRWSIVSSIRALGIT